MDLKAALAELEGIENEDRRRQGDATLSNPLHFRSACRHNFIGGGGFGAMTDSQPTDSKGNALLEVLSRCRSHACFRYPIDGPNEIEKAFEDAIEEDSAPGRRIVLIRNGCASSGAMG